MLWQSSDVAKANFSTNCVAGHRLHLDRAHLRITFRFRNGNSCPSCTLLTLGYLMPREMFWSSSKIRPTSLDDEPPHLVQRRRLLTLKPRGRPEIAWGLTDE
jgi:hypothetical protein